jgi:hypothetical protein
MNISKKFVALGLASAVFALAFIYRRVRSKPARKLEADPPESRLVR